MQSPGNLVLFGRRKAMIGSSENPSIFGNVYNTSGRILPKRILDKETIGVGLVKLGGNADGISKTNNNERT
jgi:hypothetical protein